MALDTIQNKSDEILLLKKVGALKAPQVDLVKKIVFCICWNVEIFTK